MPKQKISEFNSNPALNTDIDSINIAEGCSPSGINDAIRELMSQLKDWQAGTSNDPMVIGSSGSLTLNQGTANGVAYLNGSKVVTSGSALTFDGTNLTLGTTGALLKLARLTDGALTGSVGSRTSGNFSFYNSGGSSTEITVAASDIRFDIGASEQMRLTSTGLGIGTSSPSQKLHVVGNALVTPSGGWTTGGVATQYFGDIYGSIKYDYNTTNFLISSYGTFSIATNGTSPTTRLTVDSSGNLGLGVTPSAWAWPNGSAGALQLQSGAAVSGYNATTYLSQNWYYNAGEKYIANGFATRYEQTTGKHAWYTAASGTAGNAVSWTQAMTLDASGNLGVGTTSPSANGRLTLDKAGFNQILIRAGGVDKLLFYADSAVSSVDSQSNPLTFYTNSAERARIDTSGNLLVGWTTVPSNWKSSFYTDTSAAWPLSVRGNNRGMIFRVSQSSGIVAYFETSDGAAVAGNISVSGTSTTYATSSDYRLKENVQPMQNALAIVAQLNPCTYTWKIDGSSGQGFIAHELQAVVPDAVVGEKDDVNEDGSIKPQGIDTSFLVATLTAAIQELKAEFDAYKASHP